MGKLEEEIESPIRSNTGSEMERDYLPSSGPYNKNSKQSACSEILVQSLNTKSMSLDRTNFEGNCYGNVNIVLQQDNITQREELVSKIYQVQQQINKLQNDLNLLANHKYLQALNTCDVAPSAIVPDVVSKDVALSKITEMQQTINKLQQEIIWLNNQTNVLDTKSSSSSVFHDDC